MKNATLSLATRRAADLEPEPRSVATEQESGREGAGRSDGGSDAGASRHAVPCVPDTIRRLIDRTTFGFSWEELEYAYVNGYDAYLDRQLNPDAIADNALEARLQQFVTLRESARQHMLRSWAGDYTMTDELWQTTLLRGVMSKRQLFERVVEFWSDHLNIYCYKGRCKTFKPIDDRDVVRRHAMGRFSDLLRASAHSPAMLAYLDNVYSDAASPSENYARELMELHTIGVDQFTQQDVREVARCFTGWSVDLDEDSPTLGTFQFRPECHDYGAKTVLGVSIPPGGGLEDGDRVINILCHSPRGAPLTARFLARKLATRFWGDDPPPALIDEIADTYQHTAGDIKSMLRVVLAERWIGCAPAKLKRPRHLVLSVLRTLPTDIPTFVTLSSVLNTMSHFPFDWVAPNGYPDSDEYWAGHILPRWRVGFRLLQEQSEMPIDTSVFIRDTPEEVLDAIDMYIHGGAMPPHERARLEQYLYDGPFNEDRILDAAAMATAFPAFQLH